MGINIIKKNPTAGEITSSLTGSNDAPGLHFDGTAGNIDIASPPDLGTKFSFEFIIQADEWGSSADYLIDFGTGGRFLFYAEGSTSYNLAIWDTGLRTFGVKVLDDLKVHHLVLTVDGTAAILYDNGNQVGTTTLGASSDIDSCTDARIGARFNADAGYFFNGTLYRTRFWNKTLTAAEVTASYENATVPVAEQSSVQAELVTGGDFASSSGWTLGTGWSIGSGKATSDGSQSSTSNLYRTSAVTEKLGKTYRVTFTVSSRTAGEVWVNIGGNKNTTKRSTNGTFTEVIETRVSVDNNIYIQADADFVGSIDDVSITQVGCVSDYDLAFANPTQSLLIQDRAGNADGTASATGVVQVTPIEQLNSKAARIGTSAATPADGELLVSGDVLIGDGSADIVGYNRALTVATHTAGQISAIELVSHQNGDADLSGVEFVNDTTRVASIFASRSGADNSGKLSLATVNAGVFSAKMTIDPAGNVLMPSGGQLQITDSSVGTDPAVDDSAFIKLTNSDIGTVGEVWGINFSSYDGSTDRMGAFVQAYGDFATNWNTSLIFGTRGVAGDVTKRLTIHDSGIITQQTNQNGNTIFQVKNATAGTAADAQLRCESDGSLGLISALSPSYSTSNAYVADSFLVMSASTCSAGLGLAAEGANEINLWTNNVKRVTISSAGTTTISPTGNVKGLYFPTSPTTTDNVIQVDADSLTDGRMAYFKSNASSTNTRSLVYIKNDHASATGTTCFEVRNDSTGKAIYANGGGIVERYGVLKENLLTNSGFDVWSNSTLVSSVTGAAPAAADAGDLVNAATAGSGTAWTGATGATPPNGWSATWAGLFAIDGSSGSGAEPALKITVDSTPTENPGIVDSWTVVVGKLYQFSFRFKKGASATGGIVYLGTSSGGTQYNRWDPTSGTWATYTHVFEATTATVHAGLRCDSAIDGQHCWYDSVMLHEVVPGCVAADALAFDGWVKDSTLDLWRQHNDGGTNTKDGSFYSLKTTAGAGGDWLYWPQYQGDAEWYQRFAGRTVTFGCWVKTSTASHARLRFISSAVNSGYHTGGGAWEWLEVTESLGDSITSFYAQFDMSVSGATAYFSQPMLVFGSAIGEGNYSRPQGEIVNCEAQITIYDDIALLATDDKILNLEALSNGKIPKGCKAISATSLIKNTTVGDDQGVAWGMSASDWRDLRNNPVINGWHHPAAGRVRCDSNGDIYQLVYEADATISYAALKTTAIELR